MQYLLDTHILLWALQNNPKLGSSTKKIITDSKYELYFSSASVWEIAIKISRGYVDGLIDPTLFYQTLLANDYKELVINSKHASRVLTLPMIHKDPFDRIIIAQSLVEDMVVITADSKLNSYDIKIIEV